MGKHRNLHSCEPGRPSPRGRVVLRVLCEAEAQPETQQRPRGVLTIQILKSDPWGTWTSQNPHSTPGSSHLLVKRSDFSQRRHRLEHPPFFLVFFTCLSLQCSIYRWTNNKTGTQSSVGMTWHTPRCEQVAVPSSPWSCMTKIT